MNYSDYVYDLGAFRQRDLTITAQYNAEYLYERYYAIDDKVQLLARKRAKLVSLFIPTTAHVIDYGCGTNSTVKELRRMGHVWARGYDIVSEFSEVEKPFNYPWDMICFFDSLEHLVDPLDVLTRFSTKWVIVSVPEASQWRNPEWFMSWKHRRPGEHLWHWDREGLSVFMKCLGYRCILQSNIEDLVRIPDNPGEPNILTAVFVR